MKMLSTVGRHPRLITATIFGALVLNFAAVSFAGDGSDVPRTTVQFGDLDVSTPRGAATLYSRIEEAAHRVCQYYDVDPDPIDLMESSLQIACVHKAIARAVNKVGARQLIATYNAANHQHD